MKPVVRIVLAAGLVAFAGAVAVVWPFLQAMHIGFVEALSAVFGGGR